MLDVQSFLSDVKSGVESLLKESITAELIDLKRVAHDFISRSEEDLKRWTELLALGQITEADYRSLVKGIRGLGEITALKELGLGKAKMDALKRGITETIVGSALRLINT